MTARINTVIGTYWGGVARVLDILYALAAFGALGGLPPLLHVVAKYARYAMTSLREPAQRALTRDGSRRDGSRPESPVL
jgi:hypothetical protein